MTPPLIVNPEAETDLIEANAWYDTRQPGLGDEFLLCVDDVFERIRRTPTMYAVVFQDLRLATVRRFPYIVVYCPDDDQVTVLAVYHVRRDPRGWQRRA